MQLLQRYWLYIVQLNHIATLRNPLSSFGESVSSVVSVSCSELMGLNLLCSPAVVAHTWVNYTALTNKIIYCHFPLIPSPWISHYQGIFNHSNRTNADWMFWHYSLKSLQTIVWSATFIAYQNIFSCLYSDLTILLAWRQSFTIVV